MRGISTRDIYQIQETTALILRPSNARHGNYKTIAWCDASIFDDTPEAEVVLCLDLTAEKKQLASEFEHNLGARQR